MSINRWNVRVISPLNKRGLASNALAGLGATQGVIDSIEAGEFPLIVTTAQSWLEKLCIAKPTLKILRVDRDTVAAARTSGSMATFEQKMIVAMFNDPAHAIAQARAGGYGAIALTPTAETGVSIDNIVFGRIIGYFPCLTSESAIQLLGRDRNSNTPRDVYAADRGADSRESAGFDPAKIAVDWRVNAQKSAQFARLRENLAPEELDAYDAQEDRLVGILTTYAAKYAARRSADGAMLNANIVRRLLAAGHNVIHETVEIDESVRVDWAVAGEAIAVRNSTDFAKSLTTSVSEARETLRSGVGTREQIYSAQKTLLNEQYPGLDLDEVGPVRRLVIDRRGAALRELTNGWLLKNPVVAAEIDRACWRAHLGDRIIWTPTIKRGAYKTKLTADSGIQVLIEIDGDYCESSPEVIMLRDYCHKNCWELRRALGYASAFGPDTTGIECVQWFLRRLGYGQKRTRRIGGRGQQVQFWSVVDVNSSDRAAVEAALNLKWGDLIAAQGNDSDTGRSDFELLDLTKKIGSTAPPKQLPAPLNVINFVSHLVKIDADLSGIDPEIVAAAREVAA
jgi:hypothetical protein